MFNVNSSNLLDTHGKQSTVDEAEESIRYRGNFSIDRAAGGIVRRNNDKETNEHKESSREETRRERERDDAKSARWSCVWNSGGMTTGHNFMSCHLLAVAARANYSSRVRVAVVAHGRVVFSLYDRIFAALTFRSRDASFPRAKMHLLVRTICSGSLVRVKGSADRWIARRLCWYFINQ